MLDVVRELIPVECTPPSFRGEIWWDYFEVLGIILVICFWKDFFFVYIEYMIPNAEKIVNVWRDMNISYFYSRGVFK